MKMKPSIVALTLRSLMPVLIAASSIAEAVEFKAGDEVEIIRRTPLAFKGKSWREGKLGERLKVAAYRPNEKRVYLLVQDYKGQNIAVSVEEDAVSLVPLRQRALQAARGGHTKEALVLIQSACLAEPANTDLSEVRAAILEANAAIEKLAAAKIKQYSAATEAARIDKNANVNDRPNLLDQSDYSNRKRAQEMRTQAKQVRESASDSLRTAMAHYENAMAALKTLDSTAESIDWLNKLPPDLKMRFVAAIGVVKGHLNQGTNGGIDYWSAVSGISIPTSADGTPITTPTRDGVRFLSWTLGVELAKVGKSDGTEHPPEEAELWVDIEARLGLGSLQRLLDDDAKRFLASLPEKEREAVGDAEFLRGFKEGKAMRKAGMFADAGKTMPAAVRTPASAPQIQPAKVDATLKEARDIGFLMAEMRGSEAQRTINASAFVTSIALAREVLGMPDSSDEALFNAMRTLLPKIESVELIDIESIFKKMKSFRQKWSISAGEFIKEFPVYLRMCQTANRSTGGQDVTFPDALAALRAWDAGLVVSAASR